MKNRVEVAELQPGIFQIRGLNGSSHSYVIKGNYKNVMIDSGSDQNFPVLERGLFQIGLKVRHIDLGNYSLRIFHTPGHTSGCISIVETTQGLLFSADSVFAGGTLSYIAESGSIGDYIDSLTRLRCFGLQALYPGHGRISLTPIEDIDSAIANAQKMLDQR